MPPAMIDHYRPAAAAQAIIPARYPSPWTRAIWWLGHRVLCALQRNASLRGQPCAALSLLVIVVGVVPGFDLSPCALEAPVRWRESSAARLLQPRKQRLCISLELSEGFLGRDQCRLSEAIAEIGELAGQGLVVLDLGVEAGRPIRRRDDRCQQREDRRPHGKAG